MTKDLNHDHDYALDPGIDLIVRILQRAGIETVQSCAGGDGHSYAEPSVEFDGDRSAGLLAVHVALSNALPVRAIHRKWDVEDGELRGPRWEMVFWDTVPPRAELASTSGT